MNRVIITAVALSLFCLVACKNKTGGIPADCLPKLTMEKVLMDGAIAESYSMIAKDSLHRAGQKDLDSLAAYYKIIFNHYHISQQQFDHSLEWYKNHPEYLDTMYADLMVTSGKLQNAFPRK